MSKFDFSRELFGYMENMKAFYVSRPLNLGGTSGSSGGSGGPPGGYVGRLPQYRVAYDTTELATLDTPLSGESLLDNLNHIRARILAVETSGTGGSGGHVIGYKSDIGFVTDYPARTNLNFGPGFTVEDSEAGDSTNVGLVTVSGASGFLNVVGLDDVGANTEVMTIGRVYLKQITVTTVSLITGISAYIEQENDNIGAWNGYIFDNNAEDEPTSMLAFTRSATVNDTVLSNGTSWPARWWHLGLTALLGPGKYWIGIELASMDTNSAVIAYDDDGSDAYITVGAATWRADADRYSFNTTTRNYSIRAALIS